MCASAVFAEEEKVQEKRGVLGTSLGYGGIGYPGSLGYGGLGYAGYGGYSGLGLSMKFYIQNI